MNGGIALQQLTPSVQDPDPGRPVGLVPGPGVEIGVDRLQVDGQLRDRLRAVDHNHRAGLVRARRDLLHWVDRPEHVRDVNHRQQLRLPSQQPFERLGVELAVVDDRHVGELGSAVGAQQLPGDDVGVVLHLGQHHQIARVHVLATPGVGDQVQRRGRVGGEDRLLDGRPEPLRDPRPGTLVELGRLDRERVHAAVHGRARMRVVARDRVDHRLRRLRGRSGIQVAQLTAIELPAQDRELGRDVGDHRGRCHLRCFSEL